MSKHNYEVGYKKPPKSGQFKPGQSGNPKGRPKGIKNLSTDLEEELNEKISLVEGGSKQQTTKQRAMLKSLFAKALSGNVSAANALIKLILGLEQSRIESNKAEVLDDEDLEILESFKADILNHHSQSEGDNHD